MQRTPHKDGAFDVQASRLDTQKITKTLTRNQEIMLCGDWYE